MSPITSARWRDKKKGVRHLFLLTSTDNADMFAFIGVCHNQKPTLTRIAKSDKAMLRTGMVRIGAGDWGQIMEDVEAS
ncbi:MAG: hypothetical protein WD425_01485 [Nitrospirales bacterium]